MTLEYLIAITPIAIAIFVAVVAYWQSRNELPRRKQRGINALPLKEGKLICFV